MCICVCMCVREACIRSKFEFTNEEQWKDTWCQIVASVNLIYLKDRYKKSSKDSKQED